MSCKQDYNAYGERIEDLGDLVLNFDYWDCECERDYIHPLSQKVCKVCGTLQEDGPSSHENEVLQQVHGESSGG